MGVVVAPDAGDEEEGAEGAGPEGLDGEPRGDELSP